jgi:hypothetical protein
MSDHKERACTRCGSFLHHEDAGCPCKQCGRAHNPDHSCTPAVDHPKCPESSTDDGFCYCDGPGCQADKPIDVSGWKMKFEKVECFMTCTSCWQRLKDGEVHVCSKPRPDGKVSAVASPWGESAIPQYVRELFREREILKAQVSVLEQQTLADRLIAEVLKEERDRLADEYLKKMCVKTGEVYDAQSQLKHYQEREQHFAKVLGVADGGQYRADWDSRILAILKDKDEALFAMKKLLDSITEANPFCPDTEEAREFLTTKCPGCRGKYTETEKHTCVREGA